MDIYWSHDLPLRSLSSNINNDEYRQARLDMESFAYSNSVGGRMGFTFPNGWGLTTGLNVTTVRRTFSYAESGTGQDQQSITNSYTYTDIPLLINYETPGFGNFYFTYHFGPVFNLTFSPSGMISDSDGMVRPIDRGSPNKINAYKKTAGMSFFGSFGMHYVINRTFDFVLEPNIRFPMGEVTESSYQLSEKNTIVGIITGIRYKF